MVEKTPHPDNRYVHALVNNDSVLVKEIYDRFSDNITRMITRNNGTTKDAKDIFQEGLIIIYEKACRGNFVLNCPFEAFLFLICKRKWLNELKKRGRGGVTIEEERLSISEPDALTLAEQTQTENDRNNLFWTKFRELGERCQQLLKLSWGGISMDEVASKMEVTYGYARKKKSECVARLMKLVKSDPAYETLI
ncbi:MAG: sigma-70 family RNA polymerase sigma factor [Bacteroidota bacterium]